MIGKVKNFLGIESVKIKLEVPEVIPYDIDFLTGKIILSSKTTQKVNSITIKLIERYVRGRGHNKLINEYVAGIVQFDKPFKIHAGEEVAFQFEMPVKIQLSEMDKLGDKNLLIKGFVKLAKLFSNVKSEFRIEATAKVAGSAIPPLTKRNIKVKF